MPCEKLAKLLSVILGPQGWFPVILFLLIFKTGLDSSQINTLLPFSFIFLIFIPLTYLYLAHRLGLSKTWELIDRKERYPFMVISLASYIILFFLINIYGSQLLKDIYVIFLAALFPIYAITYFWKISMHVALNTFAVIIVNFLFGWQLPLLYLLIPLVAWARLRLKRHTKAQLIMGFLVTATPTFLGLKYFGYI